MSADTIARLKITLDDVSPAVLRRVEVPFDIRLDQLHLTIQTAMGWTNSHLYEIRAGDVGWSTPDPDADWVGRASSRLAATVLRRIAEGRGVTPSCLTLSKIRNTNATPNLPSGSARASIPKLPMPRPSPRKLPLSPNPGPGSLQKRRLGHADPRPSADGY
jgi:Plasmid pRiA4b ORF-3-like protein